MKREEIIEKTKGFLSEEFEVERDLILPENNLQKTLDLDSLDYVDLVVVIEDSFGFKVTGEDFKGIVTFNDFFDFIENKFKK